MIRQAVILALAAPLLHASESAVEFRRVEVPGQWIVWDAPCEADPSPAAARVFWQRTWQLDSRRMESPWSDACLRGPAVPTAAVTVRTLDPKGKTPRTRIDQPFVVEVEIGGLLSGMDFPDSVSKVLLERRLESADEEPESRRILLGSNGLNRLRFPASGLNADDPTRARGEEEFIVHTLAGDGRTPTRIGGARVLVLPVASGRIVGIRSGETIDHAPQLKIVMTDLYPTSANRLILFPGSSVNGRSGKTLRLRNIDAENCANVSFSFKTLDRHLSGDGTYTLALISDTVYGRELLADPITFQVRRNLQASADTAGGRRGPAP
ncbi:MAG: hypothetical protein KDN05_13215 [Verrucomicrobiae bacterium]|nr:hypothetical protein [Verrucomicrobiae bacterium]